jgi:hypothetical protein
MKVAECSWKFGRELSILVVFAVANSRLRMSFAAAFGDELFGEEEGSSESDKMRARKGRLQQELGNNGSSLCSDMRDINTIPRCSLIFFITVFRDLSTPSVNSERPVRSTC